MELNRFDRMSNALNEVVKYLAAFLLGAMTIIVFLQVLFRYVLEHPLDWSEELGTFTFVWMVLLGASVGLKRNEHPRLELFFNILPKRTKKIVYVFRNGAILFLLMVLFIYGWRLTILMKSQLTAAFQYPVSFVYAVLPISAGIMFLHLTIQTILLLSREDGEAFS